MQDATSSDDEEEISHRPAKRKGGQQVFDDDDDAESDGGVDTGAGAGRTSVGADTGATAAPAAKKPRATVVVDSDSDDAVEAIDKGMSLLRVGRGLLVSHLSHKMLARSKIRHRSVQEMGVLLLHHSRCPFAHKCASNQVLAPIAH